MSIAYDSENIPPKEDLNNTNNNNEHVDVDLNQEQAQPLTDPVCSKGEMNQQSRRMTMRLNAQFQQKTKILRDYLAEHRFKSLKQDYTNLLIILFMSFVAIGCSLTALMTNNWMCDTNANSYSIWNTCFRSAQIDDTNNNLLNSSSLDYSLSFNLNKSKLLCANQQFYHVHIEQAEQTRLIQLSVSQGLIVCATILYLISVVCISFSYKFRKDKNLNYVRNTLVTSMIVQIVSFFMQLIGFFLFILTDRFSFSVALLFVYFALAIFSSNFINFITIEYKSYKLRQVL